MNIVIVEDNLCEQENIFRFISEYVNGKAEIRVFCSAEEYQTNKEKFTPDIAVLDIDLPVKSGINLAKEINVNIPACQIIFLTGHIEFAPEVYATKHVWFVTKDKMQRLLPQAFKKAEAELKTLKNEHLTINQKDGKLTIPVSDIIYLERDKRRTKICCEKGEYSTTENLKNILTEIENFDFVQCHSSFVVNIKKVSLLKRTEIWTTDSVCIPVSRKYVSTVRNLFGEYIGSKM